MGAMADLRSDHPIMASRETLCVLDNSNPTFSGGAAERLSPETTQADQ
jgi:hypothetical protein